MAYQFMLKKKGKDEAFIYLRYSYKDFQDVLFSTGKKINVKHWNQVKEKPNASYPGGTTTLIRFLDALKGKVTKIVTDLENEGSDPIPEEVKKRYEEETGGMIRGAVKAVTMWETFIANKSKGKTEETVRNERNSLRTFREFTIYIKKPSLTPRQITKDLLADYEDYLNTHAITFADFLEKHPEVDKDVISQYYKWLEKRKSKDQDKLKVSTKGKKLKHFKRWLKSIKHPITDEVSYKDTPGHKMSFTEAEMDLIEKYEFGSARLKRIQDLTLLQANTGLRISDRKRLGVQHNQANAISIKTKKTGASIMVPITDEIRSVFERNDYKMPELSDQKFNEGLKELIKIVLPDAQVEIVEHRDNKKIFKTVYKWEIASSHSLVRTFINIRAKRGMPVPSIATVTGKSVQVLLKNYLNYEQEQAYQDAVKYSKPTM